MANNRFPLFRLPFLALCEILNFYGPQDIIQLSLCSKRSLRVAKKFWKKKEKITAELSVRKVRIVKLFFQNHFSFKKQFFYRFAIVDAKNYHYQQMHNVRVGDALVPSVQMNEELTVTFWQDKIHGIGQLVSYIKDLFDVPTVPTSITLESEDYENEFIDTMDCLMKIQEPVQDCILQNEGPITDECLTHLLDSCKITGDLKIYGELSTQFSHNWNIHLDGLYISESSCITLQNLMNINCKHLQLRNSNLTSEDINQFLKHWQNGGNSRIEYASIEMKSINHPIIKSGIDIVPQPGKLFRFYSFMSNKVELKRGGLKIQRNDGTTGGCFLNKYSFEFGVDPFEFEVDPFDFRLDPFEFGVDHYAVY
ncbi:unnamed protein product [Caenorhabditis brenneri]